MNNIITLVPKNTFTSKLIPFTQSYFYLQSQTTQFGNIIERTCKYDNIKINYSLLQSPDRNFPKDKFNILLNYKINTKFNIQEKIDIQTFNSLHNSYIINNYSLQFNINEHNNTVVNLSNLITNKQLVINFDQYSDELNQVYNHFNSKIDKCYTYSKDL